MLNANVLPLTYINGANVCLSIFTTGLSGSCMLEFIATVFRGFAVSEGCPPLRS